MNKQITKILISTLTVLIINSSQAEYIIKQPLEESQGGHMPNNSIKYNTVGGEGNEVSQKQCEPYSELYTWSAMRGSQSLLLLQWNELSYSYVYDGGNYGYKNNNTNIILHSGLVYESIDLEGFRYTKGEGPGLRFGVCREPI